MAKVFVKSFGCSANISDGEIMKGLLSKAFDIAENKKSADVIITNICTVKGDTASLRELRKSREEFPHKKMIIAGCITKEIIPKIREILPDASFISTHNIDDITQVVEESLNDNPVTEVAKKDCRKVLLPRVRKNKTIGIVQISTGCLNKCSYCSTRLIKGSLKSFSPDDIVKDVKNLVDDGCNEIWLTGQDTACYGLDIKTDIASLLKRVCEVKGEFFVRLGMGNPQFFKKVLDKLIPEFKHEKMFKFLHIPVQSGNDDILRAMKRGYSVKEFEQIIAEFRKNIPDITISTDIIAGFPGESGEQFEDNVRLIKGIRPEVLNISRFVPREGTEAFLMKDQISGEVKKERSRKLTLLHEWIALENNKRWKGWKGKVLIDEHGKEESSIGRNFAYKPVVIKKALPIGNVYAVRIISTTPHYLVGELV